MNKMKRAERAHLYPQHNTYIISYLILFISLSLKQVSNNIDIYKTVE